MSALRDALRDLPDAVFADLLESDEAYKLVIDLPGVTAETLDVRAEDGRLTIEARRQKSAPTEFRYLREDRSLFLDAELPLPPDASAENAEGTISGGVLELTVPKRGRDVETTIDITAE
ncbi:Hsp20/alpha crystallin family protein [Natronoarchaeum philippinense]|uniref:Hsp20/alpha crystallin family protein n=1 Tax=Natronoarchaeum philippinense TaxID=558529 RepID=A0A285NAS5_NATPI|nr:Hsp20/alpha crystallin family protein [Natronoarchaeum philippinense]SNZ06013.1 Hsp20/alpha crystallin family protein [Natronoarchaeum philippinense]